MSDKITAYAEALEDFVVILEHYVNMVGGHDYAIDMLDVHDAANNLWEAAYDANLGVWPSE